jgi:hypothetical protein
MNDQYMPLDTYRSDETVDLATPDKISFAIHLVRYPAVGRCIYCGEHRGKLGDEHIVPYGRPPSGGRDPHVTIRMPAALIAEADAWGAANDTGRSEAIRRLVELGLKVKSKSTILIGGKPTLAS